MLRALLTLLALAACGVPRQPADAPARPAVPVVLVSLDGFRWDYLDRGLTPTLSRLAAGGARARALVPVFPTKTFPNHYSMVTGLYPAQHGIVGNRFTAPELDAVFSMSDTLASRDGRFWGAEPIWVTAERQGIRSATYFWPGTEAAIGGVRPTWWQPYEHERPDSTRVRQVLDWLSLPARQRPGLVTLYHSLVDAAGHEHGPDAPETDSAIARADRLVATLTEGLRLIGGANLIVVSDHGMAAAGPARTVWLDDFVRREWLREDERSPVFMAWPRPGLEDSVLQGLRRAPHLTVYRRSELPARYRLGSSPRVAPVVAVAAEGWTMAWRPREGEAHPAQLGDHGYDDSLSSMAGILVAHGPGIRPGVVVPALRSVHVHALLVALLGVRTQPTAASRDSITALLAAPGASAPARPPASRPARAAPAPSSAGPAPR